MKTPFPYTCCLYIVMVAGVTAQNTHRSTLPLSSDKPMSSPASESKPVPKPSAPQTVSFDQQTKLNIAYAKIFNTSEQTFSQRLKTAVVMEKWDDVAELMKELEPTQRRDMALKTLQKATEKVNIPMSMVLKILEGCGGPMTTAEKGMFTTIIKKTLGSFGGKDLFLKTLSTGLLGVGGEDHEGRKAAYKLCLDLGLYDEAPKYLTTTEEAKKAKDFQVIFQHFAALNSKCKTEGRANDYIRLRNLGQWLLKESKLSQRDRQSIANAILPSLGYVDEKEAVAWFVERFEKGPVVEKETVLICTKYLAKNRVSKNPALRDASLRLQKRMVDALITVTQLKDRGPVVDILASYWLEEAKRGEQRVQQENKHQQRYRWQIRSGRPAPALKLSDAGAPSMATLRETAPGSQWVSKLSPGNYLKLQEYRCNIFINTADYDQALNVVEELSKLAPKKSVGLAEKMLRSWANKANPNAGVSENQNFAGRKGIPLTRTKQLRNIEQLKTMIGKIREILGADLNETVLVTIFMRAHSNAEVYQMDDIEDVLGEPSKLSQDAIWALASQMQSQLDKPWREEDLQKAMATKRTKKELEDQVDGGYATLSTFIEHGINGQDYPIKLQALHGVVLFKYFEFKYKLNREEKDKLKTCFEIRDRAYSQFEAAVKSYAALLTKNPDTDYSIQIFELWFDTIANASSTYAVDGKVSVGTDNLDAIAAAIAQLPTLSVQEHREQLAKALLDKALEAPSEKKIALLESGLYLSKGTVVEDRYQRQLDYYQELLTEVKLQARLHGDKQVGTKPFGLFLSLLHTPELARESGGFGQYLAPEMRNPFNPRAPALKPAQKFIDNITQSFSKNFEIVNVTLGPRSVRPVDYDVTQWTGEELMAGKWQETPLAYITLRAKEEAVDTIPSTHIDLHFIDLNSGVSIPVHSRVIHSIHADSATIRPCPQLNVTQILDQRDLDKDGKLSLEILATASGVIPELDDLLKLPELAAFKRTVSDDGLQVKSIETEGGVAPVVERSWTISYKLEEKRTDMLPKSFSFPTPVIEQTELVNKIYDDANLQEVQGMVSLGWGESKPVDYIMWTLGVCFIAIVLFIIVGMVRRFSVEAAAETSQYAMPDSVTPFTVIQLLQTISDDQRLTDSDRSSIRGEIAKLESDYFSQEAAPSADNAALNALAKTWMSKVQ